MRSNTRNVVITGIPGAGKTTLVQQLLVALRYLNIAGFTTEEIREGGVRKGFELVDLKGKRRILSHVRIKSSYRVGKYGVDIEGFEEFLMTADLLDSKADLVVVDEIGKMECCSEKFTTFIREILESDKTVIATIARTGGGLIAEIKNRTDILLFELTFENRDSLATEILSAISV
jgi:nucleoside-triphosphatase